MARPTTTTHASILTGTFVIRCSVCDARQFDSRIPWIIRDARHSLLVIKCRRCNTVLTLVPDVAHPVFKALIVDPAATP